MKHKRSAFTLVELLVVIGIIALLISILLPGLQKARQQANLVSCTTRLRQVGQMLTIYSSENQGRIPFGNIVRPATADNKETRWFWVFALAQTVNRNIVGGDGYVRNISKVFSDVDTVISNDYRWVSHYACNPRVFFCPEMYNFGTKAKPLDMYKQPLDVNRKVSDIRQSANVFAIWDAPQESTWDPPEASYNAFPVPQGLDNFAFYNNGLTSPCSYQPDLEVGLPIWPNSSGTFGVGNGAAAQKQMNYDGDGVYTSDTPWRALRFRHMNNKRLAALCLDGHCEIREVGTVLRRDIYTNP